MAATSKKTGAGSRLPVHVPKVNAAQLARQTARHGALLPVKASVGSYRWVSNDPGRRWPVPAAVAVYASGVVVSAAEVNPVWLGLGSLSAAGVAYIAANKRTGDEQAATIAAAAIFAAGSWVTTAASLGLFWGHVWGPVNVSTVAFLLMYLLMYRRYRRMDRVVERENDKSDQIEWTLVRDTWGLANSLLISRTETRLGEKLVVNTMGTGKQASQFANNRLLEERIAALHKLHKSRVRIREGKSADRVEILIRHIDPWAKPIPHPLVDPEGSEIELDAVTSVYKRQAIGMDPETGNPFEIEIADKEEGANRFMVIGTSGAGKSVTVNNLLERLTACTDAMVCCIDLAKGKEMRRFRAKGALGPSAIGKKQRRKAAEILEMAVQAIQERQELSDETGEAVHIARPGAPAIILVLDEIDELFAAGDTISVRCAKALNFLMSKGRSEMVSTVLIGQRGTAKWMGGANIRANVNYRIVLKVDRKNEMVLALGEEALHLPDMAEYGAGHAGVALAVKKGNPWTSGRTFKLRELSDLDMLAEGRRPSELEPGLVEALGKKWADLVGGRWEDDTVKQPAMAGGAKGGGFSAPPPPPPDDARALDALNDWTGHDEEDGDREDDEELQEDAAEGGLDVLDAQMEAFLPDELKKKTEQHMDRAAENIERARDIIDHRKPIGEIPEEMRSAWKRSAAERMRAEAEHTIIPAPEMKIIMGLVSRPAGDGHDLGGATAAEIGDAVGVAKTDRWRIMNKLRQARLVYADPTKGRLVRWFAVGTGPRAGEGPAACGLDEPGDADA